MSKPFFRRLGLKRPASIMLALVPPFDQQQPVAESTSTILGYAQDYYSYLLSEEQEGFQADAAHHLDEDVWSKIAVKLDANHKQELERPITQEDILCALADMPSGKAPGPDVMPVEHLKTCAQALMPHLLEGFNSVWEQGQGLPKDFGLASIILVYKKGSPKDIRNWRPISLLSAPYKLLAKVLANRLAAHLPWLINSTQTGFIPGRRIHTSVLLARQVIWQALRQDPPGAFVLLDFEKAYERVAWPFLLEGMEHRGIGLRFLTTVRALLTSAQSRLLINGFLSNPLKVTRSVRQGCPLSPALYALYIEHLHDMLRADDSLVGLRLQQGDQMKISAFADDTGAITILKHQSVQALRKQIRAFERHAGARLNWHKSVVLLPAAPLFEGMRTQPMTEASTYLGITMPDALTEGTQMEGLMTKATRRMALCGKVLSTGVFGRAFLANTAASSMLWYAGAVSTPDPVPRQDYRTAVCKFIWKNNPVAAHAIHRVSLRKLIQPRADGGLGLIGPDTQIQALHLRTIVWLLLEDDKAHWKILTLQTMAEALRLRPLEVETALLHPALLTNLKRGALWTPLLAQWRTLAPLQIQPPESTDQILQQPLFGNPLICDGEGNPFPWASTKGAFGRASLRAGVFRVADLWDQETKNWKDDKHILAQLDGQTTKRERLSAIRQAIPQDWILALKLNARHLGGVGCQERRGPELYGLPDLRRT
ncbi:hypothetical protein CBR_g49318 [Chara braunii]|uniref:Reverse transcriptase domain-containing protein n=1 Tax=Chara braunii TaxID=69332 RepID=A0A388M4M1_CHABU|nr:hypothetical protein CBR_g49318 [Chara braunii]|eukprot:GBG89528.1 hypothetical protein CBR_g49318 [Chara braunii]